MKWQAVTTKYHRIRYNLLHKHATRRYNYLQITWKHTEIINEIVITHTQVEIQGAMGCKCRN